VTRSSFIVVEGTRLHWAEIGDSGAAPLVLLHGLNDSHLTWKHVAGRFAIDRRVLMPDLPGHGWSDRPNASYALSWHAHLIAEWMKAIGLQQADVLGHSFGGGVAQMLLLEIPDRIRRLVLVASGGLGKDVGWALRLAALPLVVERFGQPFMAGGTRLALRGLRDKTGIAELSALNAEPGSARAFARTVRDVVGWRGQRRLFLERAHEVATLPPIALYWGARDKLIPFAHAKAFAESVDGVVFGAFENANHYLHHEQPEAIAHAVRAFLDDPNAAPARLRSKARQSDRATQLFRRLRFARRPA
jgi:pimeloyl-ACP methyl ester carboxylesterase